MYASQPLRLTQRQKEKSSADENLFNGAPTASMPDKAGGTFRAHIAWYPGPSRQSRPVDQLCPSCLRLGLLRSLGPLATIHWKPALEPHCHAHPCSVHRVCPGHQSLLHSARTCLKRDREQCGSRHASRCNPKVCDPRVASVQSTDAAPLASPRMNLQRARNLDVELRRNDLLRRDCQIVEMRSLQSFSSRQALTVVLLLTN